MKKKYSLSFVISSMIFVSSTTVCITLFALIAMNLIPSNGATSWNAKLNEIQKLVDNSYYGEINEEHMEDSVANGYIQGLGDNYAGYFNAEDTAERSLSNSGEQIGIGINVVLLSETNQIYVQRVDPNGPAQEAGVLVGDYIIAVDGKKVSDIGTNSAYTAMEGDDGTQLEITVLRGEETIDYTIKRREFELTSVYYHMMDTTGYLLITRFNETTPKQLKAAVLEMQEQGATGLIFDLRNCGGGLVGATAEILDYLLPQGNIISATYADGKSKVLYTSDSSEIELPMAVLTNKNTASAAELFAAAIRDYGKGALIGTVTYGKGVMQRTYGLSDGSSIKFTIAEFAPPSGVSFNGVGLDPDILVDFTEEQQQHYYLLKDTEDPFINAATDYFVNHS